MRRAEAELAKIRELGQPVTAEDLNAFYETPPPELDCTRFWLAALKPLDGPAFHASKEALPILGIRSDIPPPGETWPKEVEVVQFLETYKNSMEQLHDAADRGGAARYDGDFYHYSAYVENVQGSFYGARMLALEAHLRAHQGDAAGAADSLVAVFKLGVSLEYEPMSLSQVVKLVVDRSGLERLQSLLPHVAFADEDLRRLRTNLQRIDYDRGLHRALLGERVTGVIAFQDPGYVDGVLGRGSNLSLAWKVTQGEDLAKYLTFMARLIEAAERPWPSIRDEVAIVDNELNSLDDDRLFAQFRHRLTGSLLLWSIREHVDVVARSASEVAAADAALAAEQFRRGHGRLPEDLNELVPEFLESVPLDRYDGQPLRYVVREAECLIYSVGEDGVDDGGDIDFPLRGLPLDLGFRLSIPASGE